MPPSGVRYDFSQPHTYIHGALMVAEDNDEITAFEDLDGKRSAQNLTSSWGQMAERYGAELVSIDALSQCVERLVAAIDEALDEMRESGELAELSTRYLGQDIISE